MKYLLLILILAGCADFASDPSVQIRSGDGSLCSGFFIRSDIVVTSSHCCDAGKNSVTVAYLDSNFEEREIVGTLLYSEGGRNGMAAIHVDLDGPAVEVCEGHIGNKIQVKGWIRDERQTVEGRILWKWKDKYWSNADAIHGYSGAAVVRRNGCVVSMHHGRTSTGLACSKKPVIKELELPPL